MGNTDNSFTKMPNDILCALYASRLSSKQLRVFLYIAKWTGGYDIPRPLSVKKMSKDMCEDRRNIVRTIHDLECMGLIETFRNGNGIRTDFRVLPVESWDRKVT